MRFSEMQIIDSRKHRRSNREIYTVSASGQFSLPSHIRHALEISGGDRVLVSLDAENKSLFMMKSGKEDTRAFKVYEGGHSSYWISGGWRILQKLGIAFESGKFRCRSEIVGDDEGAAIAKFTFIEAMRKPNDSVAALRCD